MIDIKLTESGDIDMTTGDLRYAESTEQHQRDILLAGKGHYKEYPAIGVDAVSYLNDTMPDEFYRAVRKEFARDGMSVKKINTEYIEAHYS